MALRREIMSYIGMGAIGGIVGYYAGVKELLGIQSERAVREPATTPTPETPPTETERSPTPEVISDPPPQTETETSPATNARFSFEQASVGDSAPAGEWYVMTDEGPHEISDTRATDGEQSVYMKGSGGLGQTRIAIDLDFTRIESIAFDAYPIQNNTYSGDIKIHIDNTDNGIGGVTQAATGQWHKIDGSVSEFDGTHTLFLRTRGDENEAFFDNGQLRDESGELISPEEVVVSG